MHIRQYKRLNPRLFEVLYTRFTLYADGMTTESGVQAAMEESRLVRMFVAFDGKRIVGWSVVYRGFYGHDDTVYSIGVYVPQTLRHRGIGMQLKLKAMKWALMNKLTTFWYDGRKEWTSFMVLPEDLKVAVVPNIGA